MHWLVRADKQSHALKWLEAEGRRALAIEARLSLAIEGVAETAGLVMGDDGALPVPPGPVSRPLLMKAA